MQGLIIFKLREPPIRIQATRLGDMLEMRPSHCRTLAAGVGAP
jgi:hypothetical protein